MMKKLMLLAALLVLSMYGGTTALRAAEPAGHSFCRGGISSNTWLADRIERAIRSNSETIQGCFATVTDFYEAFKAGDAKATNLNSKADLPAYIRGWTTERAKADYHYQSDCIYERRGGAHDVVHNCTQRELKQGEVIYKNPATGALVLLSGCANPGVTEVPPIVVEQKRCIEVHFPTYAPGTAVRIAYIDSRPLPGYCTALQIANSEEKVTDLPEECPMTYQVERAGRMVTVVCTWDDVEAAASKLLKKRAVVQNVSASFYVRKDHEGESVLYLPPEALEGETAICWELPNGQFATYGVRRDAFVDGVAVIPTEKVYGRH